MPDRRRVLFVPAVVFVALQVTPAQCQPQWLPGEPHATPSGIVCTSLLWDPDGGGPAPSVLTIGGGLAAGATNGANVATFDGVQWAAVGGLPGIVTALAMHNGQLHAATNTTGTGPFPTTTHRVHARTGSAWQTLATTNGPVNAMTSYGGLLVIGGAFTTVGGGAASSVAGWNGSAWIPLGAGVQGTVHAFASFNGSLYVGGSFASAGGAAASHLASWNGSAWSAAALFNGAVHALTVRIQPLLGQSYLFVGGSFGALTIGATTIPAQRVARLDSQANTWIGMSTGSTGTRCSVLFVRSVGINNYEVVAGFEDQTNVDRVWRLSAGTWSSLGALAEGNALVVPRTITYYGGRYTVGLDFAQHAVRSHNGSAWSPVYGPGIVGDVRALAPAGNEVVIGGTFTTISGATVNGIARGSPGAWAPLGTGVQGGLGVLALAIAPDGDVIAAGDFTIAGGAIAPRIARWNGTTWSPLGLGFDAPVHALLVLPGGDIVAGGEFTSAGGAPASRVARWNGSTWSPLGTGCSARANTLALLDGGDIVAGGDFLMAGGIAVNHIAAWNGSAWSALGSGCNGPVLALAAAPNGDLHAGGVFSVAGGFTTRLARWRNGAWTPTPSLGITVQAVSSLLVHPNGDLLVGGERFAVFGIPFTWSSHLIRIEGDLSGLTPMEVVGDNVADRVLACAVAADGDLVIGGTFHSAGGLVSVGVARLHVPCPATATPYGAGCSGLTAPLTLTALEAPWLGGSWRLRSSTFGPVSFAVRVLGFAQLNLPLAPILPGSLPGCVGLLTPDVLWLEIPTQGQLTISTPVPSTPSLVGAQVFEQVLQFENAPAGGFAISSTNALQLVVGVF